MQKTHIVRKRNRIFQIYLFCVPEILNNHGYRRGKYQNRSTSIREIGFIRLLYYNADGPPTP